MWRLFIAIKLDPTLLAAVQRVQQQLRQQLQGQPLRWSRPEGLHLTLKFLGETDPQRLPELQHALQQALQGQKPFSLEVGGLGCFPNKQRPNVLWVGVQDPEHRLQHLAAAVDKAMAGCGWPRERRPFTGHLTLARVARSARTRERRALGEMVTGVQVGSTIGQLAVANIHLMRSQLHPQGAIYTTLWTLSLAQKEDEP